MHMSGNTLLEIAEIHVRRLRSRSSIQVCQGTSYVCHTRSEIIVSAFLYVDNSRVSAVRLDRRISYIGWRGLIFFFVIYSSILHM